MKKFLVIGLMSLCGTSLRAMDVEKKAQELLKVALNSDADAKNFTDHVNKNSLDIDTVAYSSKKTLSNFLNNGLAKTTDTILRTRINGIFILTERHRSNPLEADALRTHIKEAVADNTKLFNLTAFLQGKTFNIDRIAYDPAVPKKTIGMVLDEARRDLNDKNRLVNARDILSMDNIKNFRTRPKQKSETLRTLIIDALVDQAAFEKLAIYYKRKLIHLHLQHPEVDTIPLDPEKQILLNGKVKTIGDELDERAAEANVQKILELVRPGRAKDMDTFRALFKAYKKDKTKFADLKKWFEEHPFDIDATDNGHMDKFVMTYGIEVNLRNDAALLELFKSRRSDAKGAQKKADLKASNVFWGKVANIAMIGVIGFLGFRAYRYWRKTHPQHNDEIDNTASPIAVN